MISSSWLLRSALAATVLACSLPFAISLAEAPPLPVVVKVVADSEMGYRIDSVSPESITIYLLPGDAQAGTVLWKASGLQQGQSVVLRKKSGQPSCLENRKIVYPDSYQASVKDSIDCPSNDPDVTCCEWSYSVLLKSGKKTLDTLDPVVVIRRGTGR